MGDIGWIYLSIGAAALVAVVGVIAFQQMLRGKRSGSPMQEERTVRQELTTLGGALVVLGIILGEDRLIGYSFISAGILLSIISVLTSRRKLEKSSVRVR